MQCNQYGVMEYSTIQCNIIPYSILTMQYATESA